MADEEDEEEIAYEYTGERAEGEVVELSVTVEVDEKPRTKKSNFKLLGARAGKGKASYPSGDTYEGEYAGGLREGEGVYVYKAKGWRYEGGFKAGLRHGLGTMVYSRGERYVGYWAAGVKSGQGTMYFASKDIYTGEWKGAREVHAACRAARALDAPSSLTRLLPLARARSRRSRADGLKHGAGVYYFDATGGELDGTWEGGACVAGAWLDKSGVRYTGRFENQLPSSDGVYAFPSGISVGGFSKQARAKDGSLVVSWVQQQIDGPKLEA
jgi:hypothetical protein